MNLKILKTYQILIVAIVIASILRFVYLDRIPTAITGDELLYPITAKSIYLTGHDLTGIWNPLSAFLFQYPPGEHQAELPYFIHLLFSAPFPFSLFTVKFPFALMSVGIVLLLYKISQKLFGEKTAYSTGIIAAINPWLVVMGRTGYESTPATFFYLLSLYTLLSTKSWTILFAILPLICAFYSYIGTKLIFLPFLFLALTLAYHRQKGKYLKQYGIVFAICLLFVVFFVFMLKTYSSDSRISELVLPTSQFISSEVDSIRKNSVESPFMPLLTNKFTVYCEFLITKLFRILSPTYLFIEGDQFFLPIRQSFFYFIDFLFILIASLFLFSKKRFYFIIICLFILVGTFPHLFHSTQNDFSIHLTLIFPFIIMLIGAGITETISNATKHLKLFIIALIIGFYAIGVLGFSNKYFLQYPLLGYGDFPMRVLSHYISIKNNTSPLTVYSTTSSDLLKKYIFYSNSMNADTIAQIQKIYANPYQISFQGIKFTSCDQNVSTINNSDIVIVDQKCEMKIQYPSIQIVRLIDAGNLYTIYGDILCSQHKLNPYPTGIKLNDFAVEKLQKDRFCKIYFK